MKSKVRPFDDIARSNFWNESQWVSKLCQLMQNIDKDTFSGLQYIQKIKKIIVCLDPVKNTLENKTITHTNFTPNKT